MGQKSSLSTSPLFKMSQPPSLENPFVGGDADAERLFDIYDCLNLQAWRIPLWVKITVVTNLDARLSQPPSLENPFVGVHDERWKHGLPSLNLQAWRIPLWVTTCRLLYRTCPGSQPPSLENPFVGEV